MSRTSGGQAMLNRLADTGDGLTASLATTPEREFLEQAIAGRLEFPAKAAISGRSCYGDTIWDFGDSANLRLAVTTGSKIIVPWEKWQTRFGLSDEIIIDLKRFAFLRLNCSVALLYTSGEPSIKTLVSEIRILVGLIGDICTSLTTAQICLIRTLADVRLSDLTLAFSNWRGADNSDERRVLRYLAAPVIGQSFAGGPVQWTAADIDTLRSIIHEKKRYERLPEGVFKLLSNAATRDVRQFLIAIGEEPLDQGETDRAMKPTGNLFLEAFPAFPALLRSYKTLSSARCKDYIPPPTRTGKVSHTRYGVQRKAWQRGHKIPLRDFYPWVGRARLAAQMLIALYTGARESELRLFRLNGLAPPREPSGVWVLRGTVIKDRAVDAPLDRDWWVATPIMRDAIAVLQHTAALVGSSYLFHRAGSRKDRPVAYLFPRMVVNRYLTIVDPEARWWAALNDPRAAKVLHPHMIKESLAYELRKSDCGIPAITAQLQHKCFLDRRINSTTVAYGSIDRESVARAVKDANMAYARELYHPDSRRMGGGALEFGARLRAKFEGYVGQGLTEQEVFDHFVADGLPLLADVGLGYCLGRRKILRDGREIDPPCVGSLRCNPVDCSNGIIPRSKITIWKKLATVNRSRAVDVELFHLKDVSEAMADLAEKVVASLEAA